MAQLISNGQNHGMQSFMVQIRDYDTHEPLPGKCDCVMPIFIIKSSTS